MSAAATHGGTPAYFIPQPSKWPLVGAIALLLMAFGAVGIMNQEPVLTYCLYAGFAVLIYMMFGWFGAVIHESEGRQYSKKVDTSFRWSMSWFIFSEVMFFAAFFGALGYARMLSVPELSGLDQKLLWPEFAGLWPSKGPYITEAFTPMGAWGIPAINTALLLLSGVTLTIAHHGLIAGHRKQLTIWLLITVLLGATFMGFQVYEYAHAYSEMNLKLTSGIYGSTFYMLTGFHGFHVTVGAIMLTVMWFRSLKGHFDAEHHFAFEAAAWYWHFVDVVWLLLFVLVYLL
jgi:cytochrome c oxidase subunit III